MNSCSSPLRLRGLTRYNDEENLRRARRTSGSQDFRIAGPQDPMSRRVRIFIVVFLAVGVGIVVGGRRLAVAYVARQIAQAENMEAEERALCRANEWARSSYTPSYSVVCWDAAGEEERPWQDGRYDEVASIQIRWQGGQEVRRRLLSTASLSCVFGE